MLFHPAIQFYVNNVSLTLDEAAVLEDEDLTDLELEAISTPFFRQLVVNETALLKKILNFCSQAKGMECFCHIQSMIDEKKITLNEAVRSYRKGHLQIPIFRAFVMNNYSLSELSGVKPAHFESLQTLFERKILLDEYFFALTRQQIDDVANFGGLIVNNVCSLEQLLLLTHKQSQHLHVIRSIAGKSSLLIDANVPLNFFFESENGQVIADKMKLLLTNQRLTLEDVFSRPSFGVKFNYLDNRFSTLITHGRMSINFEPTDDLFEKLKFDGVYQLLLNGTLSFEQLAELTERQCNQLEDHVTREQVVVGELSLVQIPESEKKQIFNKKMRFFDPGPKGIETTSASNKRVTFAP